MIYVSNFFISNVLEVGICDHHGFIDAALKSQLIISNTKIIFRRDCSSFLMEDFQAELDQNRKINTSYKYSKFQNTFTFVIHKMLC